MITGYFPLPGGMRFAEFDDKWDIRMLAISRAGRFTDVAINPVSAGHFQRSTTRRKVLCCTKVCSFESSIWCCGYVERTAVVRSAMLSREVQ